MNSTDIKNIWLEELKLDAVEEDQDFFDIGGHSLVMAQVQARIKNDYNKEVSMETLFRNPTIESMTRAVQEA